jgi:hypothetical protein
MKDSSAVDYSTVLYCMLEKREITHELGQAIRRNFNWDHQHREMRIAG